MSRSEDKPAKAVAWLEGTARYLVYYEDTDFSGYVYHANYLKYFERAREELVGLDYVKELYKQGLHFVVARIELAYHAPARHADTVEVRTKMRLSESPLCLVEQEATLVGGAKLVTGKIKLVVVDGSGEALRLPPDVVAYFKGLAERAGTQA
jgi:acyl-CoA thioester hydrolase